MVDELTFSLSVRVIPCFLARYSGEYKFISLDFLTLFFLGLGILVIEGVFLMFVSLIVSLITLFLTTGNCFHLFPQDPH